MKVFYGAMMSRKAIAKFVAKKFFWTEKFLLR
jgi:hypothetical protein